MKNTSGHGVSDLCDIKPTNEAMKGMYTIVNAVAITSMIGRPGVFVEKIRHAVDTRKVKYIAYMTQSRDPSALATNIPKPPTYTGIRATWRPLRASAPAISQSATTIRQPTRIRKRSLAKNNARATAATRVTPEATAAGRFRPARPVAGSGVLSGVGPGAKIRANTD